MMMIAGGKNDAILLKDLINKNVIPVMHAINFLKHPAYKAFGEFDTYAKMFIYDFIRCCGNGKINLLQIIINADKLSVYVDVNWIKVDDQSEDIAHLVSKYDIKSADFAGYIKTMRRFKRYRMKKCLFGTVSSEKYAERCVHRIIIDIDAIDRYAKSFDRKTTTIHR